MFHKNNYNGTYSNLTILHKKQLNLSTETFIWMNFVNLLTGILQNTKTHLIFEPYTIYLAGYDEDQIRIAQFKIEYIAYQEFKMIYVMKDQRSIISYKPYTSIFYSKNYKELYTKYRGICLFVKDKLIKEQKQLQEQTGYIKDLEMENYESFVIAWIPKRKEHKIAQLFQTWIAEYNQSINFTSKYELRLTINREQFNDAEPLKQITMTYIDFILFYIENDVEQFQLQNKILLKLVDDGWKILFKIYSSNLLYCQQAEQNINNFLNQQSLEIFKMELIDLCEDFDKFMLDLQGILKKKCNLPVTLYKLDSILSIVKEIDRRFETKIQNYIFSLGFKQCLFFSKQQENTLALKIIKDIIDLRLKFNQIIKQKQLEMSSLSQSFQSCKSTLIYSQYVKSSILHQHLKDKEQFIPQISSQECKEQLALPDLTSKYQSNQNQGSFTSDQKSKVSKEFVQPSQKIQMDDFQHNQSDCSNGGTFNSMESLRKEYSSLDSSDNSEINELQEFCHEMQSQQNLNKQKNKKSIEEEKFTQLIQIHHISQQFIRQVLQVGFDQKSIVYKLKESTKLYLKDWESSLRNYLKSQDTIKISDLDLNFYDDQIAINTKMNYQQVSAIFDQFFAVSMISKFIIYKNIISFFETMQIDLFFFNQLQIIQFIKQKIQKQVKLFRICLINTTCCVIQSNKNSQDFIDQLQEAYGVESKQIRFQQIGLITKKQYEQLEVDEKGRQFAIEIYNYLYFEAHIQQKINKLMNCNSQDQDESIRISEVGLGNKIIVVLSQQQLNYLGENYQELECNKLIKFGKYVSNTFYYVEIENNRELYEDAADKIRRIGYELVDTYGNKKKQKYKNQQIIQLKQNSWKLCIYSNIKKFYTKLINDLLEMKFNEKEYLQILQGGVKLSELQIDLGKFQIKNEKDINKLDQMILDDSNYKCISQKIDQIKPGNYLTVVVRSEQLPIENVTQLYPETSLIRGYFEIQKNYSKQQQKNF